MDVKLIHNQSVDVVQNTQMSPSNLRSITMMNENKNSIMKVENSIQEEQNEDGLQSPISPGMKSHINSVKGNDLTAQYHNKDSSTSNQNMNS